MRLLLTSAGIKNTSIQNALVDLLGKPIADSNALCIPTATHANPGWCCPGMELDRRAPAAGVTGMHSYSGTTSLSLQADDHPGLP